MKIIYVDGYKIRQTLDPDFNVLHLKRREMGNFDSKWYIPENEIWLDSYFKEEEKFLIDIETANLEGGNRQAYKDKFCKKSPPPPFIEKEEADDNLKIKYVNGRIIREYFDPFFVMGGHDLVYNYVPQGEIWLDNHINPLDLPHVLAHEKYERELMAEGKSYDVAHDYATAREKESRRLDGAVYIGDENHSGILDVKNYYV